ncbi:hypothetical protein RND81_06G230500 [Saponaria officinalis]|uniref:Uncharacterized protein n=1 Tax=Saponaria officinalis TaxID=3572 RepID=A0AAW1KFQ7_SAPOF
MKRFIYLAAMVHQRNGPVKYLIRQKNVGMILLFPIDIGKSDRVSLILASAGQKALVWREDYRLPLQQYEYDPQYLRWNLFDQKGVLSHICAIVGKPITVEENTSIYWVDRKCKIWAFNYGNSKLYMGSIIGLAHEAAFRQGIECTVQLLHLKEQVFCLIWVDVCNRDVYYLHQTLVRLSRVPSWESSSPLDSIHRFYVAVMDCFHYRINSLVQIDNVFKW